MANSTFKWRHQPKLATAFLSGLAEQSRWDSALDVLSLMSSVDVELNVYHLGASLMGIDRAERWLTAWQLLQHAERSQVQSSTRLQLSALSAARAWWPMAVGQLQEMQEVNLECNTFISNAAISACEKGQQWKTSLQLLQQAEEPDSISFNASIAASEWLLAIHLLGGMLLTRCMASVVSCAAAISACADAAAWHTALALAEECSFSNAFTYSSTLTACALRNQWLETLQLFATMAQDVVQ